MRLITALILIGSLVAIVGSGKAATRGISKGDWNTDEFSEPAYASRWGYGSTDQGSVITVTADASRAKTDKSSIKLDTTGGQDTWAYFPNTKDMDLDTSACTAFEFFLRSEKTEEFGTDAKVVFKDMAGNAARFEGSKLLRMRDAAKGWVSFAVPVSASAQPLIEESARKAWLDKTKTGVVPPEWITTVDPGFDWKHIASFEIHTIGGSGYRVWYDDVHFVSVTEPSPLTWWLSSLDKPDLSVTWAEQLPHYKRYRPGDYSNPSQNDVKSKHWPDEGEDVKYVVHIRNVGFLKSAATDFSCSIDGKVTKTDRVPELAPQQEITVEVPWKWKQGPYKFEGRVDTEGKMDEISKKNNVLAFNTDAYTLYAICETGMTKQVDAVNNSYGSFSYEDWLRGSTVDTMNWLIMKSTYDFAPQGAKVRVRVGKVYVVDQATDQYREREELTDYDGGWVYGSKGAMEYCDLANTFMWALNHELSHQIGIIDDYQFNLEPFNNKINGKGYNQEATFGMGGIMVGGSIGSNTPPAYADIDVVGMNATYGKRRGYFGEYLYNLPEKNTLVLMLDGKPASDVDVSVYQKREDNGLVEGDPVYTGKTDSEGRFPLANRSGKGEEKYSEQGFTTITGCVMKANPFGHINITGFNGVFLVRAEVDGKWYYGFTDIGRFAVEKARGHEDATYKIELKPDDPK
jgi:hypothetical protein